MSTPTASGVTIRAETEHDDAQIADVVARAFGSNDEARLVDAIRAPHEYIAGLALVAPIEAGQVLRLSNDDPDLRGRVVYPDSFDVLGGTSTGPAPSAPSR